MFAVLSLSVAALAQFGLRFELGTFAGVPMLRGLLFFAGILNAILAMLPVVSIAKILFVFNSFWMSFLAIELYLARAESQDLQEESSPVETSDRRARARKKFVFNEPVPEGKDIVAVGDSQTIGNNVPKKFPWPAQLSGFTGRDVYNLSYGGLSPPEYWILLRRAITSAPEIILVGLYLGNDIWGSFHTVYDEDRYASLRSAAGSKIVDRTESEAAGIWEKVKHFENYHRTAASGSWRKFWEHSWIAKTWMRNSARPRGDRFYTIEKKTWAETKPRFGGYYENGRVRTVFTTAYRLLGMDLDREANREGLRLVKVLLGKMQWKTRQSGIRLMIVLIPTKEMVYADLVRSQKNQDAVFEKLVLSETKIRDEIIAQCRKRNIPFVDALPALRSVAGSLQIYPVGSDGHPTEAGYTQIARAVEEHLESLSWLQ